MTQAALTRTPAQRGIQVRSGGRTERVRKSVIGAVLDLLRQGDLDLPYQRLSDLSGVHQSTIYRRWPNRFVLIRDALAEQREGLRIPACHSVDDYLLRVAKAYRAFATDPLEIALCASLAGSTDEEYNSFVHSSWQSTNEELSAPLYQAIESGELSDTVNPKLIITILLDTITSQIVFSKIVPSDSFLESMVLHLTGKAYRP